MCLCLFQFTTLITHSRSSIHSTTRRRLMIFSSRCRAVLPLPLTLMKKLSRLVKVKFSLALNVFRVRFQGATSREKFPRRFTFWCGFLEIKFEWHWKSFKGLKICDFLLQKAHKKVLHAEFNIVSTTLMSIIHLCTKVVAFFVCVSTVDKKLSFS